MSLAGSNSCVGIPRNPHGPHPRPRARARLWSAPASVRSCMREILQTGGMRGYTMTGAHGRRGMSRYGRIREVTVKNGFGFVEFDRPDDAVSETAKARRCSTGGLCVKPQKCLISVWLLPSFEFADELYWSLASPGVRMLAACAGSGCSLLTALSAGIRGAEDGWCKPRRYEDLRGVRQGSPVAWPAWRWRRWIPPHCRGALFWHKLAGSQGRTLDIRPQ